MPPRLPVCSRCLRRLRHGPFFFTRGIAAAASAVTPAPDPIATLSSPPPIARYPPTQPPSHKPPDIRNAQLIRVYTSLIRSTPLMIFFQHNNLNRTEWIYVRRELRKALEKVDAQTFTNLTDSVKLQVIQLRMFSSAMAIVEHFRPETEPPVPPPHASDPATQSSFDQIVNATPNREDPIFTHALSTAARNVAAENRKNLPLAPLLCGPIAILPFPTVSTAHLKAALSILAPEKPLYKPPTRRAAPTYHDPITQSGLQKLILLGARLDGEVLGVDEPKKIGLIEGGLDGLRAQIVALLGGVAASVTGVLERSRTGVWMTLEGRRAMMEDEEKEKGDKNSVEGESAGEGEKKE